MARLIPALLLALTAGWCGTFFGGATAFGSTAFLGLLLLVLFAVGAPWQDPLRLGGLGSPLPLALWVAVALSQVSSPLPRAGRVAVVLLPAFLWLPGVVERCWPWRDERCHGVRSVSAVVAGIAAWGLGDALAHGGRAAMPLGHHNLLAAWMVTLLPLAWLPAREKGAWRWLGWGSAALAGAAVLASRSWLGALALALQGTAVLVLRVRAAPAAAASPARHRRWLLALGPLTLAALIAIELPRAGRMLSGTDPSAQARSVYAEAAWEGFQARPLQGWGPGTAPWTSALFLDPRPGVNPWGEAVGEFHSLPLHLLYEIGGAGLLLALLTGLLFCGERWAERAQARDRPLLLAALLGLAGAGVMALGSGALAVTALPVAVAVAAGAALAALPERELDLTFPMRIYAVLAGFALFPLVLAHWHYDRAILLAAVEAPERASVALSRARDLDPEHPLYRMRLALLQAGQTTRDGAIARLARDAAEDSGAVPGFWLMAGVLGQTAGEPWAEPVLETACALDPLNALPAWYLSLARPPGEEAVRAAGLALLAEPRLLAATAWERQPERLAPALEAVRRWPGVDAGWKEALLAAAGSVRRQGPTGFLQLEVDTVPALSPSLHTFRRRPWPALWPLVEVREAAAERLELPPATTLPATSPAAVEAAGCRPAVGWPSTLITR
jgi:hypothetical protein